MGDELRIGFSTTRSDYATPIPATYYDGPPAGDGAGDGAPPESDRHYAARLVVEPWLCALGLVLAFVKPPRIFAEELRAVSHALMGSAADDDAEAVTVALRLAYIACMIEDAEARRG